jgi:chromate transporter
MANPHNSDPEVSAGRIPAIQLLKAFLRLGITAFGGPAMVVYIRELAVVKNRWLSEQSFADGAALCQTIPGATAMQTSAYTGLRAGGPLGALAAFAGFGFPSFVLMVALAAVYRVSQNFSPVLAAFQGLQAIVIAIIANAASNFSDTTLKDWRDAALMTGAAVFLVLHGSPIIAIIASALLGTILHRKVDPQGRPRRAAAVNSARHTLGFAAILAIAFIVGLLILYAANRPLFDLATLMVKVDLFAFGGGFAAVPLMMHEIVNTRHWLESKVFMDGIALGQVTPGPIVITATFIAFQVAGLPGALVGTLAIFAPSFLMVLVTVPYLDRLQESRVLKRALRGVLASFVGLLTAVAISFGIALSWSIPLALIAVAAFVALRCKVDLLWVVLAGASISAAVL